MPGFDAQFCAMLESEYNTARKLIDLIIVTPEQMAEKIRSYCYRLANIVFKAVLDEIAYWRDEVIKLKDVILKSKYFKNTKRICNDMMRCAKLFELVANKPYFGNQTGTYLKENAEKFQQYVCNGKLLEAAQALLDSQISIANAFITSVQSAINLWVSTGLNFYIAKYQTLLKAIDIQGKLENLDAFTDCIFGACNVGASIKNYKQDLIDRLYLNPNGQVDRSRFMAILNNQLSKIDNKISELQNDMTDAQNHAPWRKIPKTEIAHN